VSLSGKARLAGVIGWPIAHSRSPRLHGYWLEKHAVDGAYLPLAIAPEDLADAVRMLPRIGFRGFNVTLPHKEAMLGLVDHVSQAARRIGAVNTVVVRADGLHGDNTDGFGFMAHLAQSQPGFRAGDRPAVVLGAGGSARAIAAALSDAGAPEIRIVNRTAERAQRLAETLGRPLVVWPWERRGEALAGAGLLVNTTQLGMSGQPRLDIALDRLPAGAVVDDIVYSPLETELLAEARRRGHPGVDGLGMLLHQARPGFAAWFGIEPAVDDGLRRHVLASLA